MSDDTYLPLIYEIDPPEGGITVDWLLANEDVWEQANPNIDVSVFRDFLRQQLTAAKNEGGTKEVSVMTLNFNRWMDSPDVFISADVWNKNTHGLSVEEGETCYGGLQVGPSGSITALALLFPGEVTRVKMTWLIAEEDLKTNDLYRDNKELIYVDPGNVLDSEVATERIIEVFQKYNMHSFCFPKPHEHNSIVQGLIKAGYEGNPISEGMSSISTPTDTWEKMLRAGEIEHFNDPILKFHNSNCMAVRKEAGTRIEKNGKVLGIYACLLAVAQWQTVEANGGDEIGIIYI
jgi:phage terminase large subunit-like protein